MFSCNRGGSCKRNYTPVFLGRLGLEGSFRGELYSFNPFAGDHKCLD